jgi:hypothetical protein
MFVLGFFSNDIWSNKNYLSLTEALAFNFYNYGCSSFTALESGAIEF